MCRVYFCLGRILDNQVKDSGARRERQQRPYLFFLNIYPHLSIKISNSIKMKMLHNTLEYTQLSFYVVCTFRIMSVRDKGPLDITQSKHHKHRSLQGPEVKGRAWLGIPILTEVGLNAQSKGTVTTQLLKNSYYVEIWAPRSKIFQIFRINWKSCRMSTLGGCGFFACTVCNCISSAQKNVWHSASTQ